MTRELKSVLVAAGAVLLAGPAPATAKDRTVKPSKVFTSVVLGYDNAGTAYCPLYTRGTHHDEDPIAGGAIVGYQNFYDPGTEPFPCWEKIDHAYRAYVRFARRSLPRRTGEAVPKVQITKAYLTFDVAAGVRAEGSVAYERASWSAAKWLGVLTKDWSASGEDGTHAQVSSFTPATFSRTLTPGDESTHAVNVTSLVTDWACGKRRNRGFVLKGLNESYGKNNNYYLTHYFNFRLLLKNVGTRKGYQRCNKPQPEIHAG